MSQYLSLSTLVCFGTLFLGVSLVSVAQAQGNLVDDHENSIVYLEVELISSQTGEVTVRTGTGFAVCEDGFILTNFHLIRTSEVGSTEQEISIRGSIGSRFNFLRPIEGPLHELERLDLALLRFSGRPPPGLSVAKLGDAQKVSIGDEVVSFGFPGRSEDLTPRYGRVLSLSASGGDWLADVPLTFGDSGGPVFNLQGEVIAIARAGFSESPISYLVPISRASNILETLTCFDQVTDEEIVRDFEINEVKSDHPILFSPHTAEYARTFFPEEGYAFVSADYRVISENFSSEVSIHIAEDGLSLTVSFELTSGPGVDQYRGWQNGMLTTLQHRLR